MYEMLRKEFYRNCMEHINAEDAAIATSILDLVMEKYELVAKENALVVYDGENVPQMVEFFLDCCRLKQLRENTITNYRHHLKRFFDTMNISPIKTQRIHIRRFLAVLEKSGLKGSTVDRYYGTLSAFFTWMQNEGIIAVNPMFNIEKPKVKKPSKQALTEVEVERLKNACGDDTFHRAIIETLFGTGVRVSELCHIRNDDILWEEKNGDMTPIRIIDGKGSKDRVVYIKDSAMLYLKAYLDSKKDDSEFVFSHSGKNYGRERMWSICNDLRKKAGITKTFSPHIARHTLATLLNKHGCPMQTIQMILGHSSMTTTSNIYAHTDAIKIASDLSRFCA